MSLSIARASDAEIEAVRQDPAAPSNPQNLDAPRGTVNPP